MAFLFHVSGLCHLFLAVQGRMAGFLHSFWAAYSLRLLARTEEVIKKNAHTNQESIGVSKY